jgi:ribulose-phosphate 3-epimerase
MKQEVIPAVMPENINDIASAAVSVRHAVETVQLDLMDGKYVPESTWPFTTQGTYDLEDARKGDFGLPHWEEINYELDLMVTKPEEHLQDYLSLGASRIIFHLASVNNWESIAGIDQTTRTFCEIGLAITVHDNLQKAYQLIDDGVVDFVQVMGIARIGFQGEPFEPAIFDVINSVRARYPDLVISVDGGVNTETIGALSEAGVTRFVSGSAVFGHGLAEENVEELRSLL